MPNQIFQYFDNLTDIQKNQFAQLEPIYKYWNSQINVISRKDISHLYIHHVLHSLAIAKIIEFEAETKVMDYGTGGGFPGIPLAIMYPNCKFDLVDSVGKKIVVAKAVVKELGLKNVDCWHMRAEQIDKKFDFVISRAVAKTDVIWPNVEEKINDDCKNKLPNGLLYLTGDDVQKYLQKGVFCKKWLIEEMFEDGYFASKVLVLLTKSSKI